MRLCCFGIHKWSDWVTIEAISHVAKSGRHAFMSVFQVRVCDHCKYKQVNKKEIR